MEMILHGERIATDDIRLLPTPEQLDACLTSSSHGADAAGTLYNKGAFSDFGFTDTSVVTPEPGGFKVSVILDNPLPERLVGRAGFNLEFLPSIYRNQTYSVDNGKTTGLIPAAPSSSMVDNKPTEQWQTTDQ